MLEMLGDEAGLSEELRLMYVALTRAKDELTIHVPLRFHVNRFASDDRHVYAQISRFLEPSANSLTNARLMPPTTTSAPQRRWGSPTRSTPGSQRSGINRALMSSLPSAAWPTSRLRP